MNYSNQRDNVNDLRCIIIGVMAFFYIGSCLESCYHSANVF